MNTIDGSAQVLIAKLQNQGYARTTRGSITLMHKREFRFTRFSLVDTVVGIGTEPGTATGAQFLAHDESTKEGAMELKSPWPLGFGGSVEMFSVLFAESADASALTAARSQGPKRWSILSAHALIHGKPPQTELFEGRALWGAAYIKSQRRKLQAMLD